MTRTEPGVRLYFLAPERSEVPAGWTHLLEEAGAPPLLATSWSELLEAGFPDVVFVFPAAQSEAAPAREPYRDRLAGTHWVAVVADVDAARELYDQGYDELLALEAPLALVEGPIRRVRKFRDASEELRRLLEESLAAYEELRWLDRMRRNLRELDFERLAEHVLGDVASVLNSRRALLWLADPADGGRLVLACRIGRHGELPEELRLDTLPFAGRLLAGEFVEAGWQAQAAAWIPLFEEERLAALFTVLLPGKRRLLNRDAARLRMLLEWIAIALTNAREMERLRGVLRTRHAESFATDAFRQHLEKALERARRYGREFTVAALGFAEPPSDRLRATILDLLRDADVCEEPQETTLRIYLAETPYLGGVQFLKRIRRELRLRGFTQESRGLVGAVASFRHHGDELTTILGTLAARLQEARAEFPLLRQLEQTQPSRLPELLAVHEQHLELDDPNAWADLAFHLVQEVSTLTPEDARLLLHLGPYDEALRLFTPLLEYPARWDRILLVAALAGEEELSGEHLVRAIRDPELTDLYLAAYDRPRGGYLTWIRRTPEGWRGGALDSGPVIETVFHRFEDRYMLQQPWVRR